MFSSLLSIVEQSALALTLHSVSGFSVSSSEASCLARATHQEHGSSDLFPCRIHDMSFGFWTIISIACNKRKHKEPLFLDVKERNISWWHFSRSWSIYLIPWRKSRSFSLCPSQKVARIINLFQVYRHRYLIPFQATIISRIPAFQYHSKLEHIRQKKSSQSLATVYQAVPYLRSEVQMYNISRYKTSACYFVIVAVMSDYTWTKVAALPGLFYSLEFQNRVELLNIIAFNLKRLLH